ncbi:hypothetical protein ACFU5P_31140 [Streptomyces sp. NPDC057433]|uniref:hypothetical protein n=1 Tax=Streptomyces sp. NPDC057433 TaxID=3346132 RepID=UPI0036D13C14
MIKLGVRKTRAGAARGPLAVAATALLTVTALVALPQSTAHAADTLGATAAEKGRCFGAAVAANHLGEAQYPNGNGSLAAGASTSFGFTVMTNGNTTPPNVGACTAS